MKLIDILKDARLVDSRAQGRRVLEEVRLWALDKAAAYKLQDRPLSAISYEHVAELLQGEVETP